MPLIHAGSERAVGVLFESYVCVMLICRQGQRHRTSAAESTGAGIRIRTPLGSMLQTRSSDLNGLPQCLEVASVQTNCGFDRAIGSDHLVIRSAVPHLLESSRKLRPVVETVVRNS